MRLNRECKSNGKIDLTSLAKKIGEIHAVPSKQGIGLYSKEQYEAMLKPHTSNIMRDNSCSMIFTVLNCAVETTKKYLSKDLLQLCGINPGDGFLIEEIGREFYLLKKE